MKKKVSLMIAVILIVQILLPMLTIIWESDFTLISKAADTHEHEATVDGITWVYELDSNNNAIKVKPKDKDSLPQDVIIPNTLNGCTVLSIDDNAFYKCKNITRITIPNSVTEMGICTFCYCSNLKSINIPDGVTKIGYRLFECCSSLTNISIPEGVTNIEKYAFQACGNLTYIDINKNNKNYVSIDGILFNKDKTTLICYPAGKKDIQYVIPIGVKKIEERAFLGCVDLKSIKISDTVTSIGEGAFGGCKGLTSVSIPSGVTTIGNSVFLECSSLTSINIPEGVTSIGDCSFGHCSSLTDIEIPSTVTCIGDAAFEYCTSLKSINIPEGVTSIGEIAFITCVSLTAVHIPESLTVINVPKNLTQIENRAFYGCKTIVAIQTGTNSEDVITTELPNILKRTLDEEDIMYAQGEAPTLRNCTISEDNETITFNLNDLNDNKVNITINGGALNGLTVVVVPSGTIFYNKTEWTNEDVTARIYVEEGEEITNNEGRNTYTFEENGTFTFTYKDEEENEYESTAEVTWIDKQAPIINSVTGNPTEWTKENVTLTVNASDSLSGIKEYSFDGGENWQEENTKDYNQNTNGIVIKVRDNAGNIATYDTINITKIIKLAKGDANGDGEVDFKDMLAINKHRLKKKVLTGEKLIVADVNKDGEVDFKDMLKINKYRLGKISSL